MAADSKPPSRRVATRPKKDEAGKAGKAGADRPTAAAPPRTAVPAPAPKAAAPGARAKGSTVATPPKQEAEARRPAVKVPAVKKAVAVKPATRKPAAKEVPAPAKPAVKEVPAPAKPAAKEPTVKRPATKKPAAKEVPGPAKEAAVVKPATRKPAAKQAAAAPPEAKKPTAKEVRPAPPPPSPFSVGDKVVYPHHGAAVITRKERVEFQGQRTEYFVLEVATDQLILKVPVHTAVERGVRPVISRTVARKVLATFKEPPEEAGANWSRWYKLLTEKINSGDIFQVAEVVRDLTFAQQTKGISPALKRMLSKARLILASELRFALDVTEEEAMRRLDKSLPRVEADGEF